MQDKRKKPEIGMIGKMIMKKVQEIKIKVLDDFFANVHK
jgi:hypothetical protein